MKSSHIDMQSPPAATRDVNSLERRMRRGGAFGAAQQIVYWASRFVATPITIKSVGYEGFGFWAFLFLIMGMAGLSRTGILSGAVPRVARFIAQGRVACAERAVRAAATLALVPGAVFGLALAIAAPLIVRWIGVPPEMAAGAVVAARLAIVSTWLSLGLGGAQVVLEARQEFAFVRTLETAAFVAEFGILVLLLRAGFGLAGLAAAYAVRQWLPLYFYFRAAARGPAAICALPGAVRCDDAREILKLGGTLQGIASLQMFGASAERIVCARGLSLAAAGAFEAARKLVNLATTVPAQLTAPLTAGGATRAAIGNRGSLADILRPATRLTAILAGVPLAFAITSSHEVVACWLGSAGDPVAVALPVFAVAAFIHITTGPSTALLRGIVSTKFETRYTLAWMLGAPPLLFLGCRFGGLLGTAIGAAAAQAIPSAWLLWKAYPSLGAGRRHLVGDIFSPFAVALAFASTSTLLQPSSAAGRIWTFSYLAAAGAVTLAAVFFIHRPVSRAAALSESIA